MDFLEISIKKIVNTFLDIMYKLNVKKNRCSKCFNKKIRKKIYVKIQISIFAVFVQSDFLLWKALGRNVMATVN